MKLCLAEAESADLTAFVSGLDRTVSSELTLIETTRAVVRAVGHSGVPVVDRVCARLDMISIDGAVLQTARTLEPPGLRSLDAIHLATVLQPQPTPLLVAYDDRLLDAARSLDLEALSPGR